MHDQVQHAKWAESLDSAELIPRLVTAVDADTEWHAEGSCGFCADVAALRDEVQRRGITPTADELVRIGIYWQG